MELERRRRRRRQRRKDRKAVVAEEDARSIHDVSDDLLWRILLGLDSPLWLIRASCACKRWRRVVTGDAADQGRTFLRLASSLHPPTIVGQYHNVTGSEHRFVPSSPPPAPIDGSRFFGDHLLQKSRWGYGWHVVDCHGGLVLLSMTFERVPGCSAPCLIVYDPLTRRHYTIYDRPPLPKEFTGYGFRDTFLLDGDDGDISISNFRVLYRFGDGAPAGPQTCVFSTVNGGGEDWRFLGQPADAATSCRGQFAGRVDRCLYVGLRRGSVIALDNASLLFSKVELPIRIRVDTSSGPSTFTVVHGGTGGIGPTLPARMTTSIVHVCGKELELFRRIHGSGEWVLEHSIANLSEATRDLSAACLDECMLVEWRTMVDAIADDGAGLAILSCSGHDRECFFSINVNTMEMRVLPEEPYRRETKTTVGSFIYTYEVGIVNYTLPWPHFLRACP